ncbi:MAG TPA: hypothetical protein VNM90_18030 [Haliangium sp.]|nr:hypothetical protein [Haliangium sp.]
MAESRSVLPANSPARFGSYGGLLAGLVLAGFALRMLFGGSDKPMPFQLAVLLAGALQVFLCGLTLRRSRAAWAFALSLNGTLAAIFLFGAPQLRDAYGVSMIVGMLPTVGFGVITTLLAMSSEEIG